MANYPALNEFIAKIKSDGLLLSSHFHVVIGGPDNGENRNVMMMCEATNLPGLSLMTNNLIVFGENRETPYGITYPGLDMNFILDRNMEVKKFFTDWSNQVFNRETRTIGYRSSYTRDIDIFVTDKEGNIVHNVKFYECYPKMVSDQSFSYSSTDVLKLSVNIVFKYWKQSIPVDAPVINRAIQSDSVYQVIQTPEVTESLGSGTGFRMPAGLSGFGSAANLPREITSFGSGLGSDIYRNASAFNAITSSTPYLNANTGMLGTSIQSLGRSSNAFGQALAGLGDGIRAVTGPASAMGTAVSSMAGTLGSVNSAMAALGLGSPFSGIITNMNNVAGKIAVVSNVMGIPGQLSTIGSSMSAMGGVFNSTVDQMKTIPSGSQKLSDAMKNLGNVFTTKGNGTQNLSSEIQAGAASGIWD